MSMTMKNTKAELLAHIAAQDARLIELARELAEARLQRSVAQGAAQLRAQPQIVTRGGQQFRVEVRRNGASVTKRFIPVAAPAVPAHTGLGPVPESAEECEFGDMEYQWRLREAGL